MQRAYSQSKRQKQLRLNDSSGKKIKNTKEMKKEKEVCEEKDRDEDKLLAGEGTDGETELTRRVRILFLQPEALII